MTTASRWRAPESARQGRVICIGNFDGVHRGHQALIRRGKSLAQTLGVEGVTALSFWPPPSHYFRPDSPLHVLSVPDERSELLRQAGVEEPIFLPFDQSIAELAAETFAAQILVDQLRSTGVVVGADFRFGTQRRGDTNLLRSVLAKTGGAVDIVTKVETGGIAISSSRIRSLISNGHFEQGVELLGHPYPLSGKVIPGDQRGRQIGFPTANLDVPVEKLLPPAGVYGGKAHWNEQMYPVIVNIGTKPTFTSGGALCVEAHLLNTPNGLDLYGQHLRLELEYHLRAEQRFDHVEALTRQIAVDIEKLQRRLA